MRDIGNFVVTLVIWTLVILSLATVTETLTLPSWDVPVLLSLAPLASSQWVQSTTSATRGWTCCRTSSDELLTSSRRLSYDMPDMLNHESGEPGGRKPGARLKGGGK